MTTGSAETWRPILGYEGLYEVSDLGRIRSLDRIEPGRTNPDGTVRMRIRRGKIRKIAIGPLGYRHLTLSRDGQFKNWMVHALVLEAFVSPRPDGQVTRHLDGDPTNNQVGNLAWGTQTENHFDTIRHGRNRRLMNATCPLGHPFSGPNLRLYKQGNNTTRICRACQMAYNRTKQRRRRGEEVDVVAVAHSCYAEIVGAHSVQTNVLEMVE